MGTFTVILASESHRLQPVLVLSVRWWPTPAGVGRILAELLLSRIVLDLSHVGLHLRVHKCH
jgi:hypothetical protein